MAVGLAPSIGIFYQALGNDGLPLSGGLLYTYSAGGTNNLATYTSYTGGTPNSNPIVLDGSGRPPAEIWLTTATSYRFDLKTSAGVLVASCDGVTT